MDKNKPVQYIYILERVLKMLFVRCASHLVGDLCQMKGA